MSALHSGATESSTRLPGPQDRTTDWATELVADWPAFTTEQVAQLAAILRPAVTPSTARAA